MTLLVFWVGLTLGSIVGLFIAALLQAASDENDDYYG